MAMVQKATIKIEKEITERDTNKILNEQFRN